MTATLPPPPSPARVLGAPVLPAHHRRTARTWRTLGITLVALFLGVCFAGVLAAVQQAAGPVGFSLGILLASMPAVAGVAAIMWVDRYEPEPRALVWFSFGWGCAVAALAAAIINTATSELIAAATGEEALTTTAVVVSPIVEEAVKGLGVLVIALAVRREFDGPVDGVVFAALVGIGFAFTENILYFGEAFLQGSEDAGLGGALAATGVTFFARAVLGPFAHPLFTAAIGVGIGIAVTTPRRWLRLVAPVLGYLVAVALHALWNFSATAGLGGFLAAYAMIMLPILGGALALILALRSRERAVLRRVLPRYVASGWIPAYDVAMISSLDGRRNARQWARKAAGPGAEAAMREYQSAATELSFLRDRAERMPMPDFEQRENGLLLELARARAELPPALRAPLR